MLRPVYPFLLTLLAAALAVGLVACGDDDDSTGDGAATDPAVEMADDLFIPSALALDTTEGSASVTLPLYEGVGPDGAPVYYVVSDSSDEADADERGVNFAPKLANALGTDAVQTGTEDGGVITFEGGVDFAPERAVTPGPDGFPPDAVTPGAAGDDLYSPLVSIDGEVVINASHVMNATGTHDSVIDIDVDAGEVTLKLLGGFFAGQKQVYLRLDASADVVAALEESTHAPRLGATPGEGSNAEDSARSAIIPVVNGIREAGDPDRQGLQSAVLGEGEPLNILQSSPGGADYSPVWDVSPVVWTDEASDDRRLLTGASEVAAAIASGELAPGGEGAAHDELGINSAGFVSNCPTVAVVG